MAERGFDKRVDDIVTARREVGTFSPVLNRFLHLSEADHLAFVRAGENELRERLNPEPCNCYPKGFISMSREQKARLKQEHIEAGLHELGCPMWKDLTPLYSRPGDSIPPSYTQQQRRRDADAERVDYTPVRWTKE